MTNGGNTAMKEWFTKYGLLEREVEEKYVTIAAKYYRDRLKARSDNHDFTTPEPEVEAGAQPEEIEPPEEEKHEQPPPPPVSSGLFGFFNSVKAKTLEWKNDMSQKAEEIKQTDTFRRFEEGWDKTVDGIKTKTTAVMDSEVM
jgi:hypothetical protein